ncbi:MAG TPA: Lrp/AsnC ligand binding domain-containing protein [Actinomycetota bacterium]|nr:Lrp/AsnC ligand binding domain-containing protein [Actinomycetota bacterium]
MVTAIVLINSDVHKVPETAQALADLEHVSEVYSVSGEYDLVALVRVAEHDQLADVVTAEIARIPSITATQTLIAFRAYSRHDLDSLFSIGFADAD